MDHRMRAPNHGFSQLAASFLACPHLGIPRVPLLRLTSSNDCRVWVSSRVSFRVRVRSRRRKELALLTLCLTLTLNLSLSLTLP